MSQDVRFIQIVFENLDHITIPSHYFYDFTMKDIHTEVGRAAANAILKLSIAYTVMFDLMPEANKDAAGFEGDIHYLSLGEMTLFQRLEFQDITHFKLIYADKTEEEFTVPWEDDEDEFHNRRQSASLDSEGRLRVQIINEV